MTEKDFVNGIYFNEPHANAPDFVKGKLSIKRTALIEWLNDRLEDTIRVDIKQSKAGKIYLEVDDWKPDNSGSNDAPPF